MNTQQSYYSTGLAGHIPHQMSSALSTAQTRYPEPDPIEAGPFHPLAVPPAYQSQQELIGRLIAMNTQLCEYVASLSAPWADYQCKTVARLCDLMELEHGYCTPKTAEFLEDHHGINPTAETGDVVGKYAEFALLPAGHGIR